MFLIFIVALLVSSAASDDVDAPCTDDRLLREFPSSLVSQPITIVTGTSVAPFVSTACTGVPCGFDIDLMNLISFLYRKKFDYQFIPFLSLIPTVANNVNTISISAITITIERMKSVNFVQFFSTGTGFIVRSTYEKPIDTLADLCNKTVAVMSGTIQEEAVQKQNILCNPNNITILSEATLSVIVNDILTCKADVGLSDEILLQTAVLNSNNQLKIVGSSFGNQPYGILCNQNNPDLCCALVNAINYLIQQGVYAQLLERYSFSYSSNGVCPSRINLEGSTCLKQCTPSDSFCDTYLG